MDQLPVQLKVREVDMSSCWPQTDVSWLSSQGDVDGTPPGALMRWDGYARTSTVMRRTVSRGRMSMWNVRCSPTRHVVVTLTPTTGVSVPWGTIGVCPAASGPISPRMPHHAAISPTAPAVGTGGSSSSNGSVQPRSMKSKMLGGGRVRGDQAKRSWKLT